MSKDCGPSKDALNLDKEIGGAMDTVKDSFIGSAAGGIADGISGLKSSLEGLTDGIKSKVEAAVPDIPKPKANLQEEMTAMMSSMDNPGEFLSKMKGIKENFGSNINIDDTCYFFEDTIENLVEAKRFNWITILIGNYTEDIKIRYPQIDFIFPNIQVALDYFNN